jgi:hypothetical protein
MISKLFGLRSSSHSCGWPMPGFATDECVNGGPALRFHTPLQLLSARVCVQIASEADRRRALRSSARARLQRSSRQSGANDRNFERFACSRGPPPSQWIPHDKLGGLSAKHARRRCQPGRHTAWRCGRAGGAHVRERGPIVASQWPTARLVFIGGIRLARCAS